MSEKQPTIETNDVPRKAKRDRILDGLRGQNEPATLEVGTWSDGQWKRTGERRGFWCQPDAVPVEARSPGEAIEKYRDMVADGDLGIDHNHHTDAIRALRAERGDVTGDGTRLPDGPVIATWMDVAQPRVELLLYVRACLWKDPRENYWARWELQEAIASAHLRVKPLPPALAEPMLPLQSEEEP